MHLRSHIRAFQAHWMRRYLDPGKPPWKSIADLWLEEPYPAGRGTILAAIIGNLYTDIPPKAKYLRACVKEFETIKLIQDTSILDDKVAGEPLDLNHRFTIPLDGDTMAQWSKYVGFKRINNPYR